VPTRKKTLSFCKRVPMVKVVDVLAASGLARSKGEARRLIP